MIRWAIFGTSSISNTVADAIVQSDGSVLSAVAGRTPGSVGDFATKYGIPKQYLSFEDALFDPEIDAVYIGLPNHLHMPVAKAAADAGKAILSEKSLTTTYEDAVELIDAVRARDVFFVEGLMYLSHPFIRELGSVLRGEPIGAIRAINGSYAADIKDLVNPKGCGTLYNLGCYPASLLHFVIQHACGEGVFSKNEILAVGKLNSDGNVCDSTAVVRFENGIQASLQSTDSYGKHFNFEILGELGTITFKTNPWFPGPGDNIFEIRKYDAPVEKVVVSDPFNAFYHQIKMVEDNLRQGATQASRPAPRWNDSLEIMGFLTEWERLAR